MLNKLTTTVAKSVISRRISNVYSIRTAATKVKLRDTMDDIPVPSGCWDTVYKANQTKYNLTLAAGVIFFSTTMVATVTSGIIPWELYLTPEYPKD